MHQRVVFHWQRNPAQTFTTRTWFIPMLIVVNRQRVEQLLLPAGGQAGAENTVAGL
ncbi:hypothetical protein D3C81_2134330 [compost metagenome]